MEVVCDSRRDAENVFCTVTDTESVETLSDSLCEDVASEMDADAVNVEALSERDREIVWPRVVSLRDCEALSECDGVSCDREPDALLRGDTELEGVGSDRVEDADGIEFDRECVASETERDAVPVGALFDIVSAGVMEGDPALFVSADGVRDSVSSFVPEADFHDPVLDTVRVRVFTAPPFV